MLLGGLTQKSRRGAGAKGSGEGSRTTEPNPFAAEYATEGVKLVGFEDALKAAPWHRKHTRPPKSGLVSRIGNQSYIFQKDANYYCLKQTKASFSYRSVAQRFKIESTSFAFGDFVSKDRLIGWDLAQASIMTLPPTFAAVCL